MFFLSFYKKKLQQKKTTKKNLVTHSSIVRYYHYRLLVQKTKLNSVFSRCFLVFKNEKNFSLQIIEIVNSEKKSFRLKQQQQQAEVKQKKKWDVIPNDLSQTDFISNFFVLKTFLNETNKSLVPITPTTKQRQHTFAGKILEDSWNIFFVFRSLKILLITSSQMFYASVVFFIFSLSS